MKLKSVKFNKDEKAFDIVISLKHEEITDILEAVSNMDNTTSDGVELGSVNK